MRPTLYPDYEDEDFYEDDDADYEDYLSQWDDEPSPYSGTYSEE